MFSVDYLCISLCVCLCGESNHNTRRNNKSNPREGYIILRDGFNFYHLYSFILIWCTGRTIKPALWVKCNRWLQLLQIELRFQKSRILVFLKCYPKVAQRVLLVQEPSFVSRWQKTRLHPKVRSAGLHVENWGKTPTSLKRKKIDFIRSFTSNRNCYILYASLYKIWSWLYWLLKTSLGQYHLRVFSF